MYSATVYQLSSIGVHVDSQTFREKGADYLRANKAHIVILCVGQ